MLTIQFTCDNCQDTYKVTEGGITKRFLQEALKYVDEEGTEHEILAPDRPCHKCEKEAQVAAQLALERRKK